MTQYEKGLFLTGNERSFNFILLMQVNCKLYVYRSIPGKRPSHGKRPGSHFRGMNGERPLPGKRPGILSTVRNGKRPGHVSIFDQFFTNFFGPSTIKLSRISFSSKLSMPYSIASAVHYGVHYMECMRIGNVACTQGCARERIDLTYFNFYTW